MIDLEINPAYRCLECADVSDESGEPLYQCPKCESKGVGEDGRHCDECNRKRKKIADESCLACSEGEVESVDVIVCPACNETETVDDFVENHRACFEEDIRRSWAEERIDGLAAKWAAAEIDNGAEVNLILAVHCPCGELVDVEEFADHAAECDDATGEDDVVGDEINEAIGRAQKADAEKAAKAKADAKEKAAIEARSQFVADGLTAKVDAAIEREAKAAADAAPPALRPAILDLAKQDRVVPFYACSDGVPGCSGEPHKHAQAK